MKHLLSILIVCVSLSQAHSQGMVQANKGVFNNSIFLKDRWIKGVSTNINSPDSSSHDKVPTAKTVYQWVKDKTSEIQNFANANLTFAPNVSRFHTMQGGLLGISGGRLMSFSTLSASTDSSANLNLNTNNSGLMPDDPRPGFHSRFVMQSSSLFATSGLYVNHSKTMLHSEKGSGPLRKFSFVKVVPDSIVLNTGGSTNFYIQGLGGGSVAGDKVLVQGSDGRIRVREQKDIEECKVYIAKVAGNGAGVEPIVTVLKNTLGPITWMPTSTALLLSSTDLFTSGKTFLSCTPGYQNVYTGTAFVYGFSWVSASELALGQQWGGGTQEPVWEELYIEIRVYP